MWRVAQCASGKQDFWCWSCTALFWTFGILHTSQTSVYILFWLIFELCFCVLSLISHTLISTFIQAQIFEIFYPLFSPTLFTTENLEVLFHEQITFALSKKSVAPQTRSLTVWSIACFCRHWMVRHKNAQHTETMLTELIKAGLRPSYDEAVKAITLELHYKAHDSNTREPLCSYCLISTNLNEVKTNTASLFWWGRIYYRTERPSSSRPPCDILCVYLLLILDLINAL